MRPHKPPLTFADLAQPGVSAPIIELNERLDPLKGYRPWRKLKYVAQEAGLDPIETWRRAKLARLTTWRPIGITRAEGGQFGFNVPAEVQEQLLLIDRAIGVEATGAIGARTRSATLRKRLAVLLADGQIVDRRRAATEMEEAAQSSIMEGAATTRQDAIAMLRTGRGATTIGERMILNNYHAMQQVKQWLDRPLSVDMLVEFQTLLTTGTLKDIGHVGRLRTDSDNVRIVDQRSTETVFVPPAEYALTPLLRSICNFAEQEHTGDQFIHPVLKAAILHFLIGYAHPFPDGNGRTARAVFYWCSLRHGYSIFEFLSISEIIGKAYARYPQAYTDVEEDDGDLTYFIDFHLDVIRQALDALVDRIASEQERIESSERFVRIAGDLNLRQRLLLEHAVRNPLTRYTVKSHMNTNNVVAATARSDLEALVQQKIMVSFKKGKEVVYTIAPGVSARVERKPRRPKK